MTCTICGRAPQFHGSEGGRPGTCLSESGCHDGVFMDDDEYAEGWQPDVVYRPCPYSPKCCEACGGTGDAADPEAAGQDDCPACNGCGWKDGKAEWPVAAETFDDRLTRLLARMELARRKSRGVRLSADELQMLGISKFGEAMSESAEVRP